MKKFCKHIYVMDCGGDIIGIDGSVSKIKGKGIYCIYCKAKPKRSIPQVLKDFINLCRT